MVASVNTIMLFPGVFSVPLVVQLTQDTTPESPELFNITLLAVEGISLGTNTAQVTILDTDGEYMYY